MSVATIAVIIIPIAALQLYLAPFIPIVTAGITKLNLPGFLKVGVTAALALVVAAASTAIAEDSDLILEWEFLAAVGVAFGEAMLGYLVFRNNVVKAVEARTADIGIG